MIQHAWHFFGHPHYTVATDFKKENNIYDLDETKANIHFQQFDEIQGLLAMIKSFKFAFYFSCHI